jgi:hypothetical protein
VDSPWGGWIDRTSKYIALSPIRVPCRYSGTSVHGPRTVELARTLTSLADSIVKTDHDVEVFFA